MVVLCLPLLDPLFRVPTQTPWKNRALGMALAFGGLEMTKIPNNQLIVGDSGTSSTRIYVRREAWGGRVYGEYIFSTLGKEN